MISHFPWHEASDFACSKLPLNINSKGSSWSPVKIAAPWLWIRPLFQQKNQTFPASLSTFPLNEFTYSENPIFFGVSLEYCVRWSTSIGVVVAAWSTSIGGRIMYAEE